ncbi:MAG TPA: YggS family pyridoxal phosphate-dependent enzyme, partial [Gemmatimonadaceae bacterium]
GSHALTPFPDLADRVREVRERIDAAVRRGGHGQSVTIVAVTKTHGPEAVQAAWDAGLKDVGENRVQEALEKMDAIQLPVRWHLIGHLQRNKVKHLTRFHLLQSLDRASLADAVQSIGASGRAVEALVQVNSAGEATKGGYEPSGLAAEARRLAGMGGVHVRGAMVMAPFDAPEGELRRVFGAGRAALATLRAEGHADANELSMGMSGDYEIAVEEGATIVRLGTILFGSRAA